MAKDETSPDSRDLERLLKVARPNFEGKTSVGKSRSVSCVHCGDVCDCFGPGPGTIAYAAGAVGAALGDQVGSNE